MRSERGTWIELGIAAACAGLVMAACGTIDPGPPTGPPMGCNGSPQYFLQHVWPEYLDKYMCGKSDCHDYLTGKSSFRLKNVSGVKMPNPTDSPANWPEEWRFNYVNATRQLNCADPLSSRLLAKPAQIGTTHQGGTLFTCTAMMTCDEEKLFGCWAAQNPGPECAP